MENEADQISKMKKELDKESKTINELKPQLQQITEHSKRFFLLKFMKQIPFRLENEMMFLKRDNENGIKNFNDALEKLQAVVYLFLFICYSICFFHF